ncbi:hypothetical protein ABIA30_001678 [Mycobacterium sp. MAA66]|uniref:anti-sigma factor family protein n=1 Tax=Mycobacterium sp. MAA66 TaxID=3156297 RepID=UPI003515E0B9
MTSHLKSVGPLGDDPYETWDAAYTLGALSPDEHREYEAHLQTCDRCRAAVAELSGMPALLGLLTADELPGAAAVQAEPPLRPEVLESVLAKVRWRRRRSRLLTSAAVGVAAAVLAVGAVAVVQPEIFGAGTTETQAQQLPMSHVAPTPFNATIAMTGYSWGTRIDMACSYGDWSSGPAAPPSNLGMVVVGRDGTRNQVATWLGMSGATALPSGNTPLPVEKIAAVQLVSADTGKVLLERNL